MKALSIIVAVAAFTMGGVTQTNAQVAPKYLNDAVSVTWVAPEKYRDVDSANSNKRKYKQRVLDDLEKYLHKELPRYLTNGQKIMLKIHDLDLAGDIRPMMGRADDIRIVKSNYPPMIDIEYTVINQDSTVSKTQRKRFRDVTFNMGSASSTAKSLGYEKAMLKKWMRNELKNKI
jgi:hypothetical protein